MIADSDQDAVCDCREPHQVVIAPPGTGKTAVAARLAGLLSKELPRHARVLLLTFSNQARVQLEAEVGKLAVDVRPKIEVTNYHRFFYRTVRAYSRLLQLPLNTTIVGTSVRRRAFAAFVREDELKLHRHFLDSIAEHAWARFRHRRTPPRALLETLLSVASAEHRAGRLVFDDFGALFWKLLERSPAVAEAFRVRYPVVIADEHQDASAVQDVVVQRLASRQLVVLGDPLQLIHEFRGASRERLDSHLATACVVHRLKTPHRWRTRPSLGKWMMALRERLEGRDIECARPRQVQVIRTPADHGERGCLMRARFAALEHLNRCSLVAILVRRNEQVRQYRDYLTKQGCFPRQVTSQYLDECQAVQDFAGTATRRELAQFVVDRIADMYPTLTSIFDQLRKRLRDDIVKCERASAGAKLFLAPLQDLYLRGNMAFFSTWNECIRAARTAGHHCPASDMAHFVESTADALRLCPDADWTAHARIFADQAIAVSHAARSPTRGLVVMTVHQSKGKQFGAVVLPFVSARDYPDDDEHRRLFYVAMTRAIDEWTVIAPDGNEASELLRFLGVPHY